MTMTPPINTQNDAPEQINDWQGENPLQKARTWVTWVALSILMATAWMVGPAAAERGWLFAESVHAAAFTPGSEGANVELASLDPSEMADAFIATIREV